MALYPGADLRLIHPGTNDPAITVIGAILHVDASNAESLYTYFNGPSQGIESHFHVPKAGRPEQYRNTGYEADANYKANSFYLNGVRYGFVSIETQGYGEGLWNDHQLAEIKALLLWLSQTHKFPLRVAPGPYSPGVGFHTLYPEWSPVAKSCPGPDRKRQFYNELVPWMSNPQEDDMTPEECRTVVRQELNRLMDEPRYDEYGGDGTLRKLSHILLRTDQGVRNSPSAAEIAAAVVAALPAGQPVDQATVEAGVEAFFARKFGA